MELVSERKAKTAPIVRCGISDFELVPKVVG